MLVPVAPRTPEARTYGSQQGALARVAAEDAEEEAGDGTEGAEDVGLVSGRVEAAAADPADRLACTPLTSTLCAFAVGLLLFAVATSVYRLLQEPSARGQPGEHPAAEEPESLTGPWPQSSRLVPRVDSSCVLEVPLSAAAENWRLKSTQQGYTYQKRQEAELDRRLASRPLLCRVVPSLAENATVQAGSFVLVSLAHSLAYLRTVKHGARMSLWTMLSRRLSYSKAQNLVLFQWLGAFSPLLTKTLPEDVKRPPCAEGGISRHNYKALAVLALFDRFPGLETVTVVDADTFPVGFAVDPRDYMAIAPRRWDVIGTSDHREPVLLHGGLLIVRNSRWSKALMQKWWTYRCGSASDSGGLWRGLFEAWEAEVGFEYPANVFDSYADARKKALALVTDAKALRPDDGELACRGDCGRLFHATGCLTQPLLLPHVLVLPVVPFQGGGKLLMPMQNHLGKDQWMCHAGSDAKLCDREDSTSAWSGRYTYDAEATRTCRTHRGGAETFECDCHQALIGRRST